MVDNGQTASAVARELGITVEKLSLWRKELLSSSAAGVKSMKELEAENRALRKRAERAEMEAAILKKAALIFGNSPTKD